jgi:uncharacterized protein
VDSLDIFFIVIFALVQWRNTKLLLRAADRNFAGGMRAAARAAIFLFDALVGVSYIFTFSRALAWIGIPTQFGMLLGAASLTYLLTATGVVVLHQLLTVVRNRLGAGADADPGRRRVLNLAANAVMAAPFVVIAYGALVQRTDFRVREVDIPLPGLPPDLDGLRLLHLSDIHLSAFLSEAELARVIDISLELRPNLAVVTGDLISGRTDPLDACIRQLARLKADAGVFGCMGNHERYAQVEKKTARDAARVGIRFLRGEAQQLRFGNSVLNLAGVDFQSTSAKDLYLEGAERLIVPGATNLLLSHNSDVFPKAARQGYNLLLAGHTHGGQVTVEILDRFVNPARFFTPYVYGLYRSRSGASAAYVTRGIGTIGIPVRSGAPPEISLLRLRKA